MNDSVPQQKAELRQRLRALFTGITDAERKGLSAGLCTRLCTQPAWLASKTVLLYSPLRDEPDVAPLIALALEGDKTIALPRYSPETGGYLAAEVRDSARDLAQGLFGVDEPGPECPTIPLNRLDLVLVPGLAFDLSGRRLGRGKGYYDRLLAQVSGTKCGVAYDFQIVPEVPADSHDEKLDWILTPSRWLAVTNRGTV